METAYIQLLEPDFLSNADFFPSADVRQSVAEHRSPISNRKDTTFLNTANFFLLFFKHFPYNISYFFLLLPPENFVFKISRCPMSKNRNTEIVIFNS